MWQHTYEWPSGDPSPVSWLFLSCWSVVALAGVSSCAEGVSHQAPVIETPH